MTQTRMTSSSHWIAALSARDAGWRIRMISISDIFLLGPRDRCSARNEGAGLHVSKTAPPTGFRHETHGGMKVGIPHNVATQRLCGPELATWSFRVQPSFSTAWNSPGSAASEMHTTLALPFYCRRSLKRAGESRGQGRPKHRVT